MWCVWSVSYLQLCQCVRWETIVTTIARVVAWGSRWGGCGRGAPTGPQGGTWSILTLICLQAEQAAASSSAISSKTTARVAAILIVRAEQGRARALGTAVLAAKQRAHAAAGGLGGGGRAGDEA